MPDLTAAEELRAAAVKLRTAAQAALAARPEPWTAHTNNTITCDGDPGPRYVIGYTAHPVIEYFALLPPGFGDALADWLDATSLDHDLDRDHDGCDRTICASAAALATARAVLATATES